MNSTFTRATVGFCMLTSALAAMAWIALSALETYTPGGVWGPMLVVVMALLAEIGIYSTTLHQPIYRWIREPAEALEREQRRQDREDSRARSLD